jgi:hypothetical protein
MQDNMTRSDVRDRFQRLPTFEPGASQFEPPSLSPTTVPNVIEFLADLDARRSVLRDGLRSLEGKSFR